MGNHVAALDEQFTVERDADRSPGALAALDRRNRPALDGLDLRDLARGQDDDLVSSGRAGSSASSASTTVGPLYHWVRGVRSATPSPSRAEIGITAEGRTPRPIRCAEISSLISAKRAALKSTRSILLTTTATCLTPSRCNR